MKVSKSSVSSDDFFNLKSPLGIIMIQIIIILGITFCTW